MDGQEEAPLAFGQGSEWWQKVPSAEVRRSKDPDLVITTLLVLNI